MLTDDGTGSVVRTGPAIVNTKRKPKSHSWPVIMYPEGIRVGRVVTGKDARSGKVRHVAYTMDGARLGTFDTFNDAQASVIAKARN